ncbi:MAG: 30S ribosomal protein S27e [archaeon]|nr:30S ribosomal protein S27e [archaeon]
MVKSRFLKLTCPRCQNNQTIFGKACLEIKCIKCNYLLNKSGGGKTKIRAKIKEVLWK